MVGIRYDVGLSSPVAGSLSLGTSSPGTPSSEVICTPGTLDNAVAGGGGGRVSGGYAEDGDLGTRGEGSGLLFDLVDVAERAR